MLDTEEYEVEYLDEDAEVVQQCLETVVPVDKISINVSDEFSKIQKKNKKIYEDNELKSTKRGRKPVYTKPKKIANDSIETFNDEEKLKDFSNRKIILEAKIFDYEDPTCLPIPAILKTPKHKELYERWQKICLKQSNKSNYPKELTGAARNTIMQLTLKKETLNSIDEVHVSQKISTSSVSGQKMIDNFQGILPKFIENYEVVKPSRMPGGTANKSTTRDAFITLLRITEIEGSKVLIAHKTDESVTNVFKFLEDNQNEEKIKCLQGVSSIRCCALCYQYSYRGPKQSNTVPQDCVICGRAFTTAYNMLSHLRSHPKDVMREKKYLISRSLSKFMTYHYKCQICFKKLPSIRHMRLHLKNHHSVGSPKFCEVGSHWTL